MGRFLATAVLGGLALALQPVSSPAQQFSNSGAPPSLDSTAGNRSSSLPPPPAGKSTIIGGEIRSVDPVLDQFVLRTYGEPPMKILFDERTQVFRDGVKVSVRNLGPEEHASVQTVLDGARVFALSIHILSPSSQGDNQGRVVEFNSRTGVLSVATSISPAPVEFVVPPDSSIVRQGQPEFVATSQGWADLVAGAIVSVTFHHDPKGGDIASRVVVLAVPGSHFVFTGNISVLDLDRGLVVVVDPRDGKSYEVSFDADRFPAIRNFQIGQSVSITAGYDGTKYTADTITAN
jgi:hypothetical protein